MASKRDILFRLLGDPSGARHAIDDTKRDIKELDRAKADPKIEVKTAGAKAQLEKLQARLHRLSQQTVTPDIQIRKAGVVRQIESVERELDRLNSKKIDIGTSGGGGGAAGAGAAGGLAARAAGSFAAAGGLAVAGLAGKRAVETASDINEAVSKNRVLFGKFADDVEKFAETSAKSFGISKAAALDATGVFGNLAVALGLAPERAAKMSVRFTKLAADLASFNNASPEEALEALRAGLVGETEPLRKFGVNINENALKAEALSAGLVKADVDINKVKSSQIAAHLAQVAYTKAVEEHGKRSDEAAAAEGTLLRAVGLLNKAQYGTVPVLNAKQKALAATNLIFKQTSTAQGDFTRTSEGFANQTRILNAELSDLAATIGQEILPTVNSLIHVLTSALHGDFSELAHGLKSLVVAQLKLVLGAIKLYTLPYRKAGRALGHALHDGIKAGVHGIVSFAQAVLNKIIDAINVVVRAINSIPNISVPTPLGDVNVGIPDIDEIDHVGGRKRGVKIHKRKGSRGPAGGDPRGVFSSAGVVMHNHISVPGEKAPSPQALASKLGRLYEARFGG